MQSRHQAMIWTNDGQFTDTYMQHSASMSQFIIQPETSICWNLGPDDLFHPTIFWACDNLSLLGLEFIHVTKIGPKLFWNEKVNTLWSKSSQVCFFKFHEIFKVNPNMFTLECFMLYSVIILPSLFWFKGQQDSMQYVFLYNKLSTKNI